MLHPSRFLFHQSGFRNRVPATLLLFVLPLCFLLTGCLNLSKPTAQNEDPKESKELLSHEFFSSGSSKNEVYSMVYARNLLWVGTKDGIHTFEYPSLKKDSLEDKPFLKDHKISRMALSKDGTIYAVSDSKGLYALPNGSYEFFFTGSTRVRDIAIGPDGQSVYCATSHGVDILQNSTWSNIKVQTNVSDASQPNDVQAVSFDNSGSLWIGTGFGLYHMKQRNSFQFYFGNYQIIQGNTLINKPGNSPLTGNLFFHLFPDPAENTLYMATNGGLNILTDTQRANDRARWRAFTGDHTTSKMFGGQIQEVQVNGNSPLPTNFVHRTIKVGESVYIGTEEGLVRLKNQKWELFNFDKGLAGDNILCFLPVSRSNQAIDLVVGTNGGISIFKEKISQDS